MLSVLIEKIQFGLVNYTKQLEGTYYKGDNKFSISYIESSDYITVYQRRLIKNIIALCDNAIKDHLPPQQLAKQIMDYLMKNRTTFERWFNQFSRLQHVMVQAINSYCPAMIVWRERLAYIDEMAIVDSPLSIAESSTIDRRMIEQERQLHALRENNQRLEEKISEQQDMIRRLSENVEQLGLVLLELRATKAAHTLSNRTREVILPQIELDDFASTPAHFMA